MRTFDYDLEPTQPKEYFDREYCRDEDGKESQEEYMARIEEQSKRVWATILTDNKN